MFIGGGNSFRLLAELQRLDLVDAVRERVQSGMPYLGSSAGTNMACPSLRTSNDMPIVEPASFRALGLVPFQINPHYIDADPGSRHMGETRQERIAQFLEDNDVPVLGLREGGWLRVTGGTATVGGMAGGVLFTRDNPPRERSRPAPRRPSRQPRPAPDVTPRQRYGPHMRAIASFRARGAAASSPAGA
ncbi:MAG: dipeptidase PepE [Trebonia sp.]